MHFDYDLTEKGSLNCIRKNFQKLGFEIAKYFLENIMQTLREARDCISSNGIFKIEGNYEENVPFITREYAEDYFRKFAGNLLEHKPRYEQRYYGGVYIYETIFNPNIEFDLIPNGVDGIIIKVYEPLGGARDFLIKKLRAECANVIFGETEKSLCEKYTYTSCCHKKDIRYDFFRKSIEYNGAIFKVFFEDGIVTGVGKCT